MSRFVMTRYLFFLFVSLAFSLASNSQQVTGIWHGYFTSSDGSQYRLEFQIKQTRTGNISVNGVSYSWQDDKRFYGKATMTGSYIKSTQNIRIKEIKTVEVTNPLGGGTCIMNYDLQYSKSGREEYLEGTYLGKPEVREGKNPYEWGDCGYGKVFLRRVVTSDFYVEPFLRDKPVTAKPNLAPSKKPATGKPPVAKKNTASKPPVVKKNTPVKTPPVVKRNPPVKTPPRKDSVLISRIPPANTTSHTADSSTRIKTPVIHQKPVVVPTPTILRTRENALMTTLVVNSAEVTVKLFDNGEIDGDTISVYFDKKLMLSRKQLATAPLIIKLKMDASDDPDHELVMVAENLGRIPPNTSLMIVEAGTQRFEVRITSTEQKNALVRFRYEPK